MKNPLMGFTSGDLMDDRMVLFRENRINLFFQHSIAIPEYFFPFMPPFLKKLIVY